MGSSGKRLRGSKSMTQQLFTVGLVVLFLMIAAATSLLVFDQVRQFIAASETLPTFTIEGDEPVEVDYEAGDPLPTWNKNERVNILVMGIDQRQHEEGPWRTDTMLVLTLDPVTMSGGMLSIPRDLWVPIPGYEEGRINTAHYIGEIDDYPGGGPALAVETVRYNLGIPIHHYARVNFTAFEEMVDLIGGIDIDVPEEINDPTYPDEAYGYDPLYIPAGEQHFDGEMALKYARTRHTSGGDFDRAKRQQQVLMAIYEKVTRLDMLPKLASRAPTMWRTLQDSVVTELTLKEIIALARLASDVDRDDIRYGVIDQNYTQFWETPDGQQVLVPLRDRMRELRNYIFTAEAPNPDGEEQPEAQLEQEAATIEILNGTLTMGLAGNVSERLQQEGLQVQYIGNADRSDIAESVIVAHTGKTYTAEFIARSLGIPQKAVVHGADPGAKYDITIILGSDYQLAE